MSESQPATSDDQTIEVRYGLPKKVHDKIKTYKRILSARTDRDLTMEETLIQIVEELQIEQ